MKKILALLMLILVTAGCSPKIDNFHDGREFTLACRENESSVKSRGERGPPLKNVSWYYLIKGSNQTALKVENDKVEWKNNRILITEDVSYRLKQVTQIKKDDLTYIKTHYWEGKVNYYENGQCFLNPD